MVDILDYHRSVITDYQKYIESFVRISDEKIQKEVNKSLSKKLLWRDPLIQFNPGYQPGIPFSQMVSEGFLHYLMADIFPYTPHKHQEDAIRLGIQGKHFVVISGTGSGKSLTYLTTIFDFLLKKNGKVPKPGVNALIVYPMNALINSQFGEIEKFKKRFEDKNGEGSFPFTFGRYTGQENDEKKKQIIEDKPNILLTNYVMLELMLVRAKEKDLRKSIFQDLNFLAFDEMHTYRGRQGADVAVLIRRIQEEANNKNLVCIGTSATMSSSDDLSEQKRAVAKVASMFFGVSFSPEQVVTESLRQVITNAEPTQGLLHDFLNHPIPQQTSEEEFISNPLAAWLEQYVALEKRENETWNRRKPQSLPEVIEALADYSGVSVSDCEKRLKEILNLIQYVNVNLSKSEEGRSYLQFRLHQFFLQTGSVYCTLESADIREVTLEKESDFCVKEDEKLPWFSVVFSRLTGETFYRVNQIGGNKLKPWSDVFGYEIEEEEGEEGYLLLSPQDGDDFWEDNLAFIQEVLPPEWFDARNRERVKPDKRRFLPRRVYVDKFGDISTSTKEGHLAGWFLLAPLQFDPTIMAFFDPRSKENTKLARIGNEGRSTATTTLSLSAVLALQRLGESRKIQKVLSFTDNRQDAALQAGHFNDFVRTILLRSAIYDAVSRNGKLDYSNIDQQTVISLGLTQEDYAENPSPLTTMRSENERALRLYVFYKIMEDLRRGWRVILPNLEQCALLQIDYVDLNEVANQEQWTAIPKMNECTSEQRREIIFQLLEYMRSQFAISATNYEKQVREQNEAIIAERLKDPWKFDKQERIFEPAWMRVESSNTRVKTQSLHYQSAWGKYIKGIFQNQGHNDFRGERVNDLTKEILETLANLGYLTRDETLDKNQSLYRLPAMNILWLPGDGKSVRVDKVRLRSSRDIELQPNEFFKKFYSSDLEVLKYRLAGEHTGQLSNKRREGNEMAFKHDEEIPAEKRLSALFCSPTMELGIDISELNTVHMRNVPPSPANYVQRSGRAGRSGQGALVMTYCGNQSPHDRYYFNNPKEMVAGIVTPPNLDLTNEELWTTHVHSMFLAACSLEEFDKSVEQILDIEKPGYPLKTEVEKRLQLHPDVIHALTVNAQTLLDKAINSQGKPWWYSTDWASKTIEKAPEKFNQAFERWRNLYKSAVAAKLAANQVLNHPHISKNHPEYKEAKREFDRGQEQMDLLRNTGNADQSEFFPFRYLAAEGFMPGYNFPRLPRRVLVETSSTGGDFISRPRMLALTEFGPQNTIYYDGQKYQVYKMNLPPNEGLPLRSAKVSNKSGFILLDMDAKRDTDPFSGADLNNNENVTRYDNRLLELQDGRAMLMQRISCEEEERQRKGYDESIYFRTDHPDVQKVVKVFAYGDHLLNLRYLPSAQIVKVNHKWRASKAQVQGFPIHTKTGKWLSQKEVDDLNADPNTAGLSARVNLFSYSTANALYIEPCAKLNLSPDGIKTLMYALKRAVELHFQIEPREIAATIMGDREQPNIFLYEATEGSLGVLSQIGLDVAMFKEIVLAAYHLCHFRDGKDTHKDGELCAASYADLLDYYNQRDHSIINRHLIKGALELMRGSNFDNSPGSGTLEEQYQKLRIETDPKSELERKLLDYLFSNSLRLPDMAQVNMSKYGCYTSADFIFEKERIAIFVDGSVHDPAPIVAEDDSKRECLERLGWEVLIWHYQQSVESFVQQYPHIFTKARI